MTQLRSGNSRCSGILLERENMEVLFPKYFGICACFGVCKKVKDWTLQWQRETALKWPPKSERNCIGYRWPELKVPVVQIMSSLFTISMISCYPWQLFSTYHLSVWIDSYIPPTEHHTAGSTPHLLIIHIKQTSWQKSNYSQLIIRSCQRTKTDNVRTVSRALSGPAMSLS